MILVVKNGYRETYVARYLDKFEIVESRNSGEMERCWEEIGKYEMVIVLGGHQKVGDRELDGVKKLIELCVEIDKPLLGICLGCQLIGWAVGCEIRTLDGTCKGVCEVMGFEGVFTCHDDYVVRNDRIEVLDMWKGMVYVFKIKGVRVYGVQCHPDIPGEFVGEYGFEGAVREDGGLMKYLLELCRRI